MSEKNQPWIESNPSFAFKMLHECVAKRRPIIPLFGTGMSVDAGMPLAVELKEYFVQLHALIHELGWKDSRQYLMQANWPSRHALRLQLMQVLRKNSLLESMPLFERRASQQALASEVRRSSPTLSAGLLDVMKTGWDTAASVKSFNQLAEKVPTNTGYRSLLFHLTQNDQSLNDTCLDHFMRGRVPTTTHQFIVFLSRLLSCRVLLTTNFDFLLEEAFADEHIAVKLFEMQGETTIPLPQLLLAQQFAIIKLHGGAHQMRLGFDLDDPLPPAVQASFYEMFSRLRKSSNDQEPLMLVMGYSGSDRRVMDIVAMLIREWTGRPSPGGTPYPNILWISRDQDPPDSLTSAVNCHPLILNSSSPEAFPVHFVRYREGRLFLTELYQQLTHSFPIAHNSYQAIHFVPRLAITSEITMVPPSDEPTDVTNVTRIEDIAKGQPFWRLAVFQGTPDGRGTSSALAKLAAQREAGNRIIWIDLTEISDVSAVIDVLSDRFTKMDATLKPIQRPLLLANRSAISGVDASTAMLVDRLEIEIAKRWLSHALRRDFYLLAVDSFDEFPANHPALTPLAADADWEVNQRITLGQLFTLSGDELSIGDSRIAIANSNNEGGIFPPSEFKIFEINGSARSSWPHRAEFSKLLSHSRTDNEELALVAIAAACRRIRSEVLLTTVVLSLLHEEKTLADPFDQDFWRSLLNRQSDSFLRGNLNWAQQKEYEDLVAKVRGFGQMALTGLLPRWYYRVEGGHFWMHKPVRDDIYKDVKDTLPIFMIAVHDRLAQFYYDSVFLRSNDSRAFLEAMFHRTAAISGAYQAGMPIVAQKWSHRACDSILRDKPLLQARARIPSLVHQLRQLIDILIINYSRESGSRDYLVISSLLGVLSDFYLSSGHPHSAVRCQAFRINLLKEKVPNSLNLHQAGARFDLQIFLKDIDEAIDMIKGIGPEERVEVVWAISDAVVATADSLCFDSFPKYEHGEDWLQHMQFCDRTVRIAWCRETLTSLLETVGQVVLFPDHDARFRLKASLRKRVGELMIHSVSNPLYEHARVYMARTAPLLGDYKADASFIDNGDGEPRSTTRWRRHECYRRCLMARHKAMQDLPGNWIDITNLFVEAASKVDRQGGPADKEALAQTRLFHAEHCLRRAELLIDAMRCQMSEILRTKARADLSPSSQLLKDLSPLPSIEEYCIVATEHMLSDIRFGVVPCKISDWRFQIQSMLEQANQLILMVDETINDGRVQNRSRYYYLLTRARCLMLKAMLEPVRRNDIALEILQSAGTFLASALSNCGRMNDRRSILTHWWLALKELLRSRTGDRYPEELRRLMAMTGIRWSFYSPPVVVA